MSFTDHKITQFAHRVADLPDEPQIPAAELKSRFDACPEELRQSLNAVCDDAARLEARVEGIVAETFGDSIDKSMLSDELQDEIDAKATNASLSTAIIALENADAEINATLAQKCEVVFGSYQGDNQSERIINLGFAPLAVIVINQRGIMYDSKLGRYYGGFALADSPVKSGSNDVVLCTDNGFKVFYNSTIDIWGNSSNYTFHYLAFRPVST